VTRENVVVKNVDTKYKLECHAVLEFDETTHTYRLDGRRLISVTQALSILDDRWKVDPFYLEFGKMVHRATACYDRGEYDDFTWDERIIPSVEAYVKFRSETDFEPIHIELPLFHPTRIYAGTLDRIGTLNGRQVLIDLKTGAKARVDELQEVAYWELAIANNIPVQKLFDLYLHKNGKYNLEPVKEIPRHLLPVFLACLKIAQWREGL
jgi:hypothetical protein